VQHHKQDKESDDVCDYQLETHEFIYILFFGSCIRKMFPVIPSRTRWYLCSPVNRPSHSFSCCGENISRNLFQKVVTSSVEMMRDTVLCFMDKLDINFLLGLKNIRILEV